ncbi:MAG: chemotaxis protein CheA [Halothiobacillaceae bacterium]
MAFDANNELLQDFLIEAGELLEGLNGQLIDLERAPDDRDLLNAVFRSFHTIKGGAGFLEIDPLVEVCHRAEDVFNMLRNGERAVDSNLMDVMLRVLDVLNDMFASLRGGVLPDHTSQAFLDEIEALKHPEAPAAASPAPEPEAQPVQAPAESSEPAASAEDEAESEYASMLADIEDEEAGERSGSGDDELITDEEFESLLDQLHGPGQFKVPAPEAQAEEPTGGSGDDELITDDEFEKVLDQLYGVGKGPSTQAGGEQPAAEPEPPAKTESPAKEQPAEPPKPEPAAASASKPVVPVGGKAAGGKAPQPPVVETTVRVDTERLDAIMNMVGELVLVRNRMNTLKSTFESEDVSQVVASLDMVTSDLQAAVMKTRMQPVKKVFGRFPRVVRDVARQLGKEVDLVMEGEDTDLDKNLVEALADPLVHLVRNSVDHGIEMPDAREASGKPRSGTVTLSAAQEGDHILLSIHDDGSGMDAEKLRHKVVEKGLMDQDMASRLSENECYELILLPGFSTKDQISDISGRGVGMDVVKTAISKLSGTISIDSELGVGTRIVIKVPLTLAILPTLMVVVSGRKYALPLGVVSEIFDMDGMDTNIVDGQHTITVRDRALPLYNLKQWLALRGEQVQPLGKAEQVVLVQVGAQLIGLVVDSVIGQEEVVIKPLGEILHGVSGFAGATITGDGHIALILDLAGLVRQYGGLGRRDLRMA